MAQRSERQRRAGAFHEAGHALAAWRLGAEIILVTIRPSTWPETRRPGGGRVEHRSGLGDRRSVPYDKAIVCFAGPAAQARYDPRSGVRHAARWDHDDVENIAHIACRSPASIAPFLRWADHEARALVRSGWHCIEALAEDLLLRGTLTGAEAVAVMEAAEARHVAATQAARLALSLEYVAAAGASPATLPLLPKRHIRKATFDRAVVKALQASLWRNSEKSLETMRESILNELSLMGYPRESCCHMVDKFLAKGGHQCL